MGIVERLSGSSTAIADFGYNVATRQLVINFTDGSNYTYSGFPLSTYNGLLLASSKGGYFNANIRNQFSFSGG